jgi:hypothetical protein
MAALIANNVISSSTQINYKYLGTSDLFGYEVEGSYEIDLSDINFEQNETSLIVGRDALIEAYAKPNITARIGADDYVNGRIESFSFEDGPLVGSETVTMVIKESRRLDDYSGSEFAKYIPNPETVGSFSENYSFSRDGANYTSTRSISLTYEEDAGGQFLNNAKTFLTNYYFANRPSFGYQEDGISEDAKIDKNFRGLISESYDLIELSVSLEEKVSSSYIDDSKNVGRLETQTLEVTPEGFLNKTINIELTSLRLDSQDTLNSAISEIIDEKKDEEHAQFGSPFSISKTLTKDGNTASLVISFSTDPKKSQETIIFYSGEESKDGSFLNYRLTITFNSMGKNNKDKFKKSKEAWDAEQINYKDKIQKLFHPLKDFFEKQRGCNFDKSQGTIQETVNYTTDPSYKDLDNGLMKLKTTVSKTRQIQRIEKYFNSQNKEDEVVLNTLKTVGRGKISAEATVSQSMGVYKAKQVLESKTSDFNELFGENIITIVKDVISTNLGEGKATRSLDYLFLEED